MSGNITVRVKWSLSICFCDCSLIFVVRRPDSRKSYNGRRHIKIDETGERQIKRQQTTPRHTSSAVVSVMIGRRELYCSITIDLHPFQSSHNEHLSRYSVNNMLSNIIGDSANPRCPAFDFSARLTTESALFLTAVLFVRLSHSGSMRIGFKVSKCISHNTIDRCF